MTDERLAHLQDVAARLWPAPHLAELSTVGGGRGKPSPVAEYLLLPTSRRPRLLTPVDRRAAAAVVRHHGEGRDRRARLLSSTLALGLHAGLGSLLPGRLRVSVPSGREGDSLVDHLTRVLGRPVVVGLHLGPRRANRKPVLQLLTPGGRTIGYAKLGVNELTDALVGQEARALAQLGSMPRDVVTVPTVLHHGRWLGHELLVQSALPVWESRRPLDDRLLAAAVSEIAGSGRRDGVPLQESSYWADLTTAVERLDPEGMAGALRRLVDRFARVTVRWRVSLAPSHGDWTPWNMAASRTSLLVWDWERFRPQVPLGFDVLHFNLQRDLVTRLDDPTASARRMVREGVGQLRLLGVPAGDARRTSLLYGIDLAARYLVDRQLEAGARLGDVGAWLLPALTDGMAELEKELGDER